MIAYVGITSLYMPYREKKGMTFSMCLLKDCRCEPILMKAKNRGLLNWSMVLPELLNPGWIEVFDLFEPVTD
jgi:hypothetical protein